MPLLRRYTGLPGLRDAFNVGFDTMRKDADTWWTMYQAWLKRATEAETREADLQRQLAALASPRRDEWVPDARFIKWAEQKHSYDLDWCEGDGCFVCAGIEALKEMIRLRGVVQ